MKCQYQVYHYQNMYYIILFVWLKVEIYELFAGIIYLRSHLGKYLSVDSFGNVLCESDERDIGSRFQISIAEDGSGRWALRNESRGYFLGGTPDKLTCTAKAPSNGEFWTVHLAARPQVITSFQLNSIYLFILMLD